MIHSSPDLSRLSHGNSLPCRPTRLPHKIRLMMMMMTSQPVADSRLQVPERVAFAFNLELGGDQAWLSTT